MTDFTAKNAARKAARANGSSKQQRFAREQRRAYGGAFGNLDPAEYNDLTAGTTGNLRALPKDKGKGK